MMRDRQSPWTLNEVYDRESINRALEHPAEAEQYKKRRTDSCLSF